ncbi:MAG: AAA family ATPase [Chloracidobacterium sp.]|nr:AAA family ATPase [Chloracidobacterium sp.]
MNKKVTSGQKGEAAGPRRAADVLALEHDRYPPKAMFDAFWRAGELALMFGPAGVGKSLLAVQVADALARGCPIAGFDMSRSRCKVLYVDLINSDRQFAERYSYRVPVPGLGSVLTACKFAENLYRSRPPTGVDLCEWLAGQIAEHGFNAVVVDDLTALKKTHDGVRETLAAVRGLKKLCEELRISVLAIAGGGEPPAGKTVSESDLKRSSVLCSVADSVFAIGRGRPGDHGGRHIIQTRSRNAPLKWTTHNAPSARIARSEKGWLGFAFDERFAEPIDRRTRDAICRVRAMRAAGRTWRAIAAELKIPKTRAIRLLRKWTPEMGGEEFMGEYAEPAATADCGVRTAECGVVVQASSPPYEGGVDARVLGEQTGRFSPPGAGPVAVDRLARSPKLIHGPKRVSIYDLERRIDRGGNEIFVESVEEQTNKPRVWYKRDRRGNTFKLVRNGLGNTVSHLGQSTFL